MMSIHDAILLLIKLLEDSTLDAQKFDEGNDVAGRRLRKTLIKLEKESREVWRMAIAIKRQRMM